MCSLHTPGPWEVMPEEDNRDYIRIRGTVLGEKFKIANVCAESSAEHWTARDAEAARANARLIAAAPELLEALKEMAEYYGGAHEDDCPQDDTCDCGLKPFNDRVNLAIAKAEGREA